MSPAVPEPPDKDAPQTTSGGTPGGAGDTAPEIRVWHNDKIVYRLPADGAVVFDDVAVPLDPGSPNPPT